MYIVPVYSVKVHGCVELWRHSFLKLGARWSRVVTLMPLPPYPRGVSALFILRRRLCGPHGYPQCGEKETFLSLPGFEHHPSAAALVVSSCENENIHARFEILAAVIMMLQVLSDVRSADW
jgi:hypothetical protein